MFVVSLFVNIGMWFERYVIVVTSLHRDFIPANWKYYIPTWYDWGWTFGSFGLFFALFLLFVPVLADDRDVRSQGRHGSGRRSSGSDFGRHCTNESLNGLK